MSDYRKNILLHFYNKEIRSVFYLNTRAESDILLHLKRATYMALGLQKEYSLFPLSALFEDDIVRKLLIKYNFNIPIELGLIKAIIREDDLYDYINKKRNEYSEYPNLYDGYFNSDSINEIELLNIFYNRREDRIGESLFEKWITSLEEDASNSYWKKVLIEKQDIKLKSILQRLAEEIRDSKKAFIWPSIRLRIDLSFKDKFHRIREILHSFYLSELANKQELEIITNLPFAFTDFNFQTNNGYNYQFFRRGLARLGIENHYFNLSIEEFTWLINKPEFDIFVNVYLEMSNASESVTDFQLRFSKLVKYLDVRIIYESKPNIDIAFRNLVSFANKIVNNVLIIDELNMKRNHSIKNLAKRIEDYSQGGTPNSYFSNSYSSSLKKAEEVMKVINQREIDLSNWAILSLGGGDGAELIIEVQGLNAKKGYLFEYNTEFCKKCREEVSKIDKINVEVIEGDINDYNKLSQIKRYLEEDKVDGLLITIHAVLHELSMRTMNFDLEDYLYTLIEMHPNLVLIIREPGKMDNWPNKVIMSIGEEYFEDFKRILSIVNDRLFGGIAGNYKVFKGSNEFSIIKDLAIEAMFKFFYKSVLEYELQERITSVSRLNIHATLRSIQSKNKSIVEVSTNSLATESLKVLSQKFQISFWHKGKGIPLPECFHYHVVMKQSKPNL